MTDGGAPDPGRQGMLMTLYDSARCPSGSPASAATVLSQPRSIPSRSGMCAVWEAC